MDKISTGIKFFGQKVYLEGTDDKKVDKALKTAFKDGYWRASMYGSPVQVILEWQRGN